MQGRIEKNTAMAYNDTTVHSNVPVGRSHARMKICLQNATNGAVNCSQSCGMLEWRDELYRIHQMQKEEIAWNFGKRKDGDFLDFPLPLQPTWLQKS